MLSSPYYDENYAGIIDTSLVLASVFSADVILASLGSREQNAMLITTTILSTCNLNCVRLTNILHFTRNQKLSLGQYNNKVTHILSYS